MTDNRFLNQLVPLWLTSPYSVENVQNFFGIRRLKPDEVEESDQKKTNDEQFNSFQNGIPNGIGLTNGGPLPRSKHKPATESCQQHVDYVVDSWFWYGLFSIGAMLGDDVFYYTFIPFWSFNISVIIMRKVALIWAIIMYVGQTSKEILKWPRPQSPPVVPLESRYFKEYGMPSTHAMVGTLIPFSILFLTMDEVEYSIPIGFLVATAWMLLVCFSRLYKGMHYILDVVVGVVLTFALLGIIFPFIDKIDQYLITDRQAPLILACTVTFLSLTYPSQRGWSGTRDDTIVILSVTGSFYTSLWLNNYFQWFPDRYNDDIPSTITYPSLVQLGAMICREIIGVAITLLAHFIIKPIVLGILSLVYSIEINSETKKLLYVQFPYKYVTYSLVVFICLLGSPFVFTLFGL